ncbi:hypothetical protein [Actinocorallia longicatena]|uniref:Tetratricopeptide repeat protein n=1 Tax=Actinocorallia longicatena TaxID=111803 RepID=A0ABP6Q807_9ACTN
MNAEEIRAGLAECDRLPKGRVKAERLETLAEAARAGFDRKLEADVLLTLVRSYEYGGERDRLPVAFGRILKIYDEFPLELSSHTHTIHWQLKWMTYGLVRNPAVPLATAERWLGELESRYRQRGYSARPILSFRSLLAEYRGDRAEAEAMMDASLAAERDEMADCDACERNDWGSLRAHLGDDEGALEHWAPILDGERHCMEEPHRVLAKALLPLVRTGRIDEARSAFLRGYPMVRLQPGLREAVGFHLEFCALTGNEARGVELLAEHVAWLDERGADTAPRLGFLSGAAVLLRRLRALGHDGLTIGGRDAAGLSAEIEAEIAELAAKYDTRHGDTVFGAGVEARLSSPPLLASLPLGAVATRLPAPVAVEAGLPEETFTSLVAEARRLSAANHPGAVAAWSRVAARQEEPPADVAADLARAAALGLAAEEPPAAVVAMLAAAELYRALADTARELQCRSAAGAMLAAAGREDGPGMVERAVAAAEKAFADGVLTPAAYLRVRSHLRHAWFAAEDTAAFEAELALAAALDVPEEIARLNDGLARILLGRGETDAARPALEEAVRLALETGRPWEAADRTAILAQLALEAGDPAEAETLALRAAEYGRGAAEPDLMAAIASLRVEILQRQDRHLDVVAAALEAAGLWSELAEPDTLHNTFIAARAYQALDRHDEALSLYDQVADRIEIPYQGVSLAGARRSLGDALKAGARYDEAAEQYLQAALIVQDDPRFTRFLAELSWSAGEALEYSAGPDSAAAAYARSAALWKECDALDPYVRTSRAAAWCRFECTGDDDPGIVAMRAVVAELEAAPAGEERAALLEDTRYQLTQMLRRVSNT